MKEETAGIEKHSRVQRSKNQESTSLFLLSASSGLSLSPLPLPFLTPSFRARLPSPPPFHLLCQVPQPQPRIQESPPISHPPSLPHHQATNTQGQPLKQQTQTQTQTQNQTISISTRQHSPRPDHHHRPKVDRIQKD